MENSLSVLCTHRLISLSVLAEMEITRISSSLFYSRCLFVCLAQNRAVCFSIVSGKLRRIKPPHELYCNPKLFAMDFKSFRIVSYKLMTSRYHLTVWGPAPFFRMTFVFLTDDLVTSPGDISVSSRIKGLLPLVWPPSHLSNTGFHS